MRDQAQKELKQLREDLMEKKINVTLTKSQKSLQTLISPENIPVWLRLDVECQLTPKRGVPTWPWWAQQMEDCRLIGSWLVHSVLALLIKFVIGYSNVGVSNRGNSSNTESDSL